MNEQENQFNDAWTIIYDFIPFCIHDERYPLGATIGNWCVKYAPGDRPFEDWRVHELNEDGSAGDVIHADFDNPHDALVDCLLKAIADACEAERQETTQS